MAGLQAPPAKSFGAICLRSTRRMAGLQAPPAKSFGVICLKDVRGL